MSFSRQIASSDVLPIADFVNYIAGKWYLPAGYGAMSSGAAPGADSIRLFPGFIKQLVTINSLGLRLNVASAGGSIQAAVYANNAATMRPTGSALASTASISTTSTGSLNSAVSVQLAAGLYWFATNSDNGTSAAVSLDSAKSVASSLLGSSTQANDLTSAAGLIGLSVSQTFGTWPDLTSGSFTEVNTNSIPFVQFKVASVP
jgi:hypothetical protein